jgi:uncharacterized protein YbjT (DUF2867 family)
VAGGRVLDNTPFLEATMILVTGATGKVGREVVRQLAAEGFPVRALVRSAERADDLAGPGVELSVGDLEKPQTLDRAMAGVLRMYLASRAEPQLPEREGNAVDAARRAGVQFIVKVSVSGGPDSPTQIGRWHWAAEKHLGSSGIAYTILRPTLYMQGTFEWLPEIAAKNEFHLPMGDGRASVVDARDVAAVAVAALKAGGLPQRLYDVTGPEAISFDAVADEISAVAGRRVEYVDVTPLQWKKERVAAGIPAWLADDYLVLWSAYRKGYGANVSTAVQDVTGRPPRSFRDFFRDYAARFREGR